MIETILIACVLVMSLTNLMQLGVIHLIGKRVKKLEESK